MNVHSQRIGLAVNPSPATGVTCDDSVRGGFPIDYDKINATAGYLRHYENWLTLDFIAKATNRVQEKMQALNEMKIAERKMNWHKRHPNYDQEAVTRGVEEFKRGWSR